MIPAPLRDWLPQDMLVMGGQLAIDANCEGSKHHSPTPLVVFRTSLQPDIPVGGGGPEALLCGVCVTNFLVFQHLIKINDGNIPWEVQRQFGNRIRELAVRGWENCAVRRPRL